MVSLPLPKSGKCMIGIGLVTLHKTSAKHQHSEHIIYFCKHFDQCVSWYFWGGNIVYDANLLLKATPVTEDCVGSESHPNVCNTEICYA